MPLFITTTNKDISVNAFSKRGYPICFNKTTENREIYAYEPNGSTKYIYDGHGTRMTIGPYAHTGGGSARSSTVGNGDTWITQYEVSAGTASGAICSYSMEGSGFARVTNSTQMITVDCNLPIGTILMWSKPTNVSTASDPTQQTNYSSHNRNTLFPKGWYVCNGLNNTPNLRSRFIKGANTVAEAGNTGGTHTKTLTTANLPSHTHSLNSHTHSINHDHAAFTSGGSSAANTGSALSTHYHSYAHTHTGSSASAGAHSHTINSNTVNEGTTVNNSRTVSGGMHVHTISPSKTGMSSINQSSSDHNKTSATSVSWFNSYLPGHDHAFRDFYMIPNKDETNNGITGGTGDTAIIEKGYVSASGISKRSQTDNGDRWRLLYVTHRTWIRGAANNGQNYNITINPTSPVDVNNTYVGLWYGIGYSGVHTHNLTNTSHNHTSVESGAHTHTITVNSGGAHTHTASSASAGAHSHTITVNSGGGNTSTANLAHTHTMAHTHSIDVPAFTGTSGTASGNTGSTGSGKEFNIEPGYYQVVFIMRIS